MINSCETMCLEDSAGGTRWIRIVEFDKKLFAIESTDYAILDRGYSMRFSDHTELSSWMRHQKSAGWSVSFTTQQSSDSIDTDIIGRIELNVFIQLARNK